MDLSLFQPAPAPPTAAGFKPPGTLPGRITGLGEIFADFYYILQGVGVNQENSFGADNLTLGKKSGNRPPRAARTILGAGRRQKLAGL
jgi:hypothetical protein